MSVKRNVIYILGLHEIQYCIYHSAVAHEGLTNMAHPPFSISLTISLHSLSHSGQHRRGDICDADNRNISPCGVYANGSCVGGEATTLPCDD